ncbi:hypothetical protein [Azospirillum largimobile]
MRLADSSGFSRRRILLKGKGRAKRPLSVGFANASQVRISPEVALRHPYTTRIGPTRVREASPWNMLYPYSLGAFGHFCCPGIHGQAPSLRLGGTHGQIRAPKR